MIKKSFKPCRIKGSNSSVRCHAKSLAPERDSTRVGRCQTKSSFYASQARGRVGLSFAYESMHEAAIQLLGNSRIFELLVGIWVVRTKHIRINI